MAIILLSKWQAMSAGTLKMPVVLRVSVGSKYGAQHSQDWTSLCTHIPGLKVVFPATPYDAKGLMNSALMGTDPVIFFESQRIYDMGEMFHEGGVPEGYYEYEKVIESVRKTGKILLASDACERGSYLNDLARNIGEYAFDYLDAPPVVIGSRNWITPAHELEEFFFPQPEWIIDAIHERIIPLDGHVPTTNVTYNEKIRRDKLGV